MTVVSVDRDMFEGFLGSLILSVLSIKLFIKTYKT